MVPTKITKACTYSCVSLIDLYLLLTTVHDWFLSPARRSCIASSRLDLFIFCNFLPNRTSKRRCQWNEIKLTSCPVMRSYFSWFKLQCIRVYGFNTKITTYHKVPKQFLQIWSWGGMARKFKTKELTTIILIKICFMRWFTNSFNSSHFWSFDLKPNIRECQINLPH